MAEPSITELEQKNSPNQHDDATGGNGALGGDANRGTKRPRPSAAEEDDDDDDKPGRERRKIEIKFIQDKSRRHITFSKRKAGIMKKVGQKKIPSRSTGASSLVSRRPQQRTRRPGPAALRRPLPIELG
jgi:hypothetical protein